ncbi:LA_2272 family surface repeat-containing protein, partial [Pyxidicoccus sp. 3LG]
SGVQMSSGRQLRAHISGGQIPSSHRPVRCGAQVGLVNVAGSMDGAQVGLVNVAGSSEGESVGLLSFVGNGQAHLLAWSSDVSLTNVGVKLGSRHFYTLLTAGFTPPLGGDSRRYTIGAGFGGHIPLDRFYVDVDVVGSSLHRREWFDEDDSQHVLGQLRVMAGWQVARRFAIFGGVSANTLVTWDDSDHWDELGIGPEWRQTADRGRTVVRTWPGLLAGVQL